MEAWIDDSGAKGDGPVFIYAGFLSPAAKWTGFSQEWGIKLTEPPSIEYFKMHEAAHAIGQFENWTSDAINRKIEALLPTVRRYAEASLLVTMNLSDYENVICTENSVPRQIDFPQFLSFHGLIAGTLRHFKKYTDFYFDSDEIHEHRISAHWELVKQVIAPDIAKFLQAQPPFRDDKKFKPLQAADMLAWNMRKMASGESDSRQWIIEGLSSIPSFHLELDSSVLNSFIKESPRVLDRKIS